MKPHIYKCGRFWIFDAPKGTSLMHAQMAAMWCEFRNALIAGEIGL